MEKRYWIHAVTPIHVGSGRGLGYIDLPVAREAVTSWPYIPGSSIKGVIADKFNATEEARKKSDARPEIVAAFGVSGSDSGSEESTAGALVFTDADIFCLPVRSFYGTFAWVTSPFCLKRHNVSVKLPEYIHSDDAFITVNSVLTSLGGSEVYLEDLNLEAGDDPELRRGLEEFALGISKSIFPGKDDWQRMFADRFVVVSDDVFTFLCTSGTEVTAHIKIDPKTGTAQDGALWYEEALPVESILLGRVWCDKVYKKRPGGEIPPDELMREFCTEPLRLQLGGKASTGKGQVNCIFEAVDQNGN